jgi:hypothetical protein
LGECGYGKNTETQRHRGTKARQVFFHGITVQAVAVTVPAGAALFCTAWD